MNEEIRLALRLRLEQARETLEEADALREHGLWRGLINRSYYAMYYAVLLWGIQTSRAHQTFSGDCFL